MFILLRDIIDIVVILYNLGLKHKFALCKKCTKSLYGLTEIVTVMQTTEISWRNDGDWKARYSKFYASRYSSRVVEDQLCRISFMSEKSIPSKPLLQRVLTKKESSIYGRSTATVPISSPSELTTIMSQRSECYHSYTDKCNISSTEQVKNMKETDTLLLEMVRAKSREMNVEIQDKTLNLARDETSEAPSNEVCVHGFSTQMTDRSISRRSISQISRVSTRRDMDIPSILAFTASVTAAPSPLEIAAFQKTDSKPEKDIPRWSIRRSLCPVCSQKWRDKSSISNIKNSGLKRNSSAVLPSVIAPAKLRSSITTDYNPHPILAIVDETKSIGTMKSTGPSWQLTRARRLRTPKLQVPPPEATAPPSATEPMAQKDLDIRVNRFLKDEGIARYLLKASFNYKVY